MAPASRSDLDSPIRLIRRPPMRPPAPATTTLIMLVSCSPFLLFAAYRWLITVAGGAEPDDLRLGLREQRSQVRRQDPQSLNQPEILHYLRQFVEILLRHG